jgi:hypothetical protein
MFKEKIKETLITAGGKICCRRCNAMSKRTRIQCGAPAMQGRQKCRNHGGYSTGPITLEGLARCAKAKTIHGHETREKREAHRLGMIRIRFYAALLGLSFRSSNIYRSDSNKTSFK